MNSHEPEGLQSSMWQSRRLEDIRKELSELKQGDWSHSTGKLPLHGYYADPTVSRLAEEARQLFESANALAPGAFPSCRIMELEVVDAVLHLLGAGGSGCGNITSGGTESIVLSVKSARDRARARGLSRGGSIVVPSSAHPAFNKAAQLLDVAITRVPVGADWRSDVGAMRASIREDTFYMAGSAPSLPYGLFDKLGELSDLAIQADIWLHVDACIGGLLAPFVARAGYPVPPFDFSLSGVRSMSADLHKFGFSAKGASLILYRDPEDHSYQVHRFSDWPKGEYFTPTIAGTRSGGPIASAWAVMRYLGVEGYTELARRLMELRDRYIAGFLKIDGLQLLGNPELSAVTVTSCVAPMLQVASLMRARGWYMSVVGDPPGIQQTINLVHQEVVTSYLSDLAAAVVEAADATSAQPQAVVTY